MENRASLTSRFARSTAPAIQDVVVFHEPTLLLAIFQPEWKIITGWKILCRCQNGEYVGDLIHKRYLAVPQLLPLLTFA